VKQGGVGRPSGLAGGWLPDACGPRRVMRLRLFATHTKLAGMAERSAASYGEDVDRHGVNSTKQRTHGHAHDGIGVRYGRLNTTRAKRAFASRGTWRVTKVTCGRSRGRARFVSVEVDAALRLHACGFKRVTIRATKKTSLVSRRVIFLYLTFWELFLEVESQVGWNPAWILVR